MNRRSSNESTAQFIDRFLIRTALGVLFVALALAAGIAVHFLGSESTAGQALDWVELGLGLATLVAVLPVFLAMLLRRSRGDVTCQADGFIAEVFRRACGDAFSATFLSLLAARILADRLTGSWTVEIVVNAVLCIGLLAFSIAFFRRTGLFDDEEDGV